MAHRRGVIATELARLGATLSEPQAGTRPAAALADAVRISAEARAAHFGISSPAAPASAFPSPSEVSAALRALVDAPGAAARANAAGQLGALIHQLAAVFRGGKAPAGIALDPSAAALVRLLLAATPDAPPDAERAAMLARELLAQAGLQGAPGMSPGAVERATAALLAAVLVTREGAHPEQGAAQAGQFPAALHSLAAQVTPPRPRRGKRAEPEACEGDDETPGDSDESRSAGEQPTGRRSRPRRDGG